MRDGFISTELVSQNYATPPRKSKAKLCAIKFPSPFKGEGEDEGWSKRS